MVLEYSIQVAESLETVLMDWVLGQKDGHLENCFTPLCLRDLPYNLYTMYT